MNTRLLLGFLLALAARAQSPVVLVVTADAGDYLLSAGGTVAGMIDRGATAYLIRVSNDEKDSWDLSPEETARRTRAESEQAARILGFKEVVSLGYRAGELAGVSFTEIRDRLIFYIRLYKPRVLFIPNPYNEYDRVLDRYYTGRCAEDAWRSAGFGNYAPPLGEAGLAPHQTPELYYYGQPFDPRRREAETSATFVPELKTIDISALLGRKVKAAQALRTINYSMARRLNGRLTESGRRLRLLDTIDDDSVNRLAQKNVEGAGGNRGRGVGLRRGRRISLRGVAFPHPIEVSAMIVRRA
jgi:LmbE family N-acetylglucosaminyl deacetylase